jgi:hypothetical protein
MVEAIGMAVEIEGERERGMGMGMGMGMAGKIDVRTAGGIVEGMMRGMMGGMASWHSGGTQLAAACYVKINV